MKLAAMSPETVSSFTPMALQGNLRNPSGNITNQEFAEHEYEYWSFGPHSSMPKGHPVTQ